MSNPGSPGQNPKAVYLEPNWYIPFRDLEFETSIAKLVQGCVATKGIND
jgi:hypothetical protein